MTRAMLAFALVTSFSSVLSAQTDSALDAEPPSLEARSDDLGTPWWSLGTSVDLVGAVFGQYAVRFHIGISRHHGVVLSPGWRRDKGHGPMLGVAYEVWPLGEGLHGLGIVVEAIAAWIPGERDRVDLSIGADLAYRYVWSGVQLGVAGGAARHWHFRSDLREKWRPVVRMTLGWAWS